MENIEKSGERLDTNIVTLGPDDWEAYKELRLSSLRSEPTAFGRDYEEEADRTEEEWRKRLEDPNHKTYAASSEGKLVGMVGATTMSGKRVEHMANVGRVFVSERLRGKGIGEALMQQAIKELRENPKIMKLRLSVNEPQEAAKKMYEKLGFEQSGYAKKEIRVGDTYYDQIQMEMLFEDKLNAQKANP